MAAVILSIVAYASECSLAGQGVRMGRGMGLNLKSCSRELVFDWKEIKNGIVMTCERVLKKKAELKNLMDASPLLAGKVVGHIDFSKIMKEIISIGQAAEAENILQKYFEPTLEKFEPLHAFINSLHARFEEFRGIKDIKELESMDMKDMKDLDEEFQVLFVSFQARFERSKEAKDFEVLLGKIVKHKMIMGGPVAGRKKLGMKSRRLLDDSLLAEEGRLGDNQPAVGMEQRLIQVYEVFSGGCLFIIGMLMFAGHFEMGQKSLWVLACSAVVSFLVLLYVMFVVFRRSGENMRYVMGGE